MWLFCYASHSLAQKEISDLRLWGASNNTRLVLDLSDAVKYHVFTLENPYRVVIDIEEVSFKARFDPKSLANSRISGLRQGKREKGVRVVLDMNEPAKPTSFLLAPNDTAGNRLVIDLAFSSQSKKEVVKSHTSTREFVVAIDPGHGGDDTGAIGHRFHLKEKDVVLSVSKKLKTLINSQQGMRAFLVRTDDYYVALRKRMRIARDQGADLFISIHADSFKDPRVSGASVFVLSEKGASNEAARWLAERENRSDLIGGIKLEDKGDLLASVLLDLSQTASQSASHELASHLIANLEKITDLHHKTVQHAGFMVLKSPDIPSVLVELGFISNQEGEQKLQALAHQQLLAKALFSGVKAYVAKRSPLKPSQETLAKR